MAAADRVTDLVGQVGRDLERARAGAELPPAELAGRPAFVFHDGPPADPAPGAGDAVPGELELHGAATDGALSLRLRYAADVFDRATADRVLRHLRVLAEAAAAAPAAPVAALPVLTEEEERTVAALNGVRTPLPELTFHQLVEVQAARTPDAVAVRSERGTLTYRELNGHANRLAHLLREDGVGPGTTVGICMERGTRMVVALLGVLKARGAYVPVDPADPAERRDGILADAEVRLVLAADQAAAPGHRTVALDEGWTVLAGRPGVDTPTPAEALDDAAYLLYTSGSTGRPKGVVVENRQLVGYTAAVIDRFGIDTPLSWAMVQPLTVDSSVTALMTPLCTGGEVHPLSRECALDANRLADWMAARAVDCLKIAPSHLRALQVSPRFAELLPRRLLVVGGEASEWRWLTALQRAVPHCRVFNHYGPTETTVGVLTLAVADHPDAAHETAPIGVPLPNSQAYVVDAVGRPVPYGVPGELLVGGVNVARGYHRQEDLTAAAFVPDTHGGGPGARLYRTGDVVRRLADGSLAFLGRRDDQIKIRGFRVALGEIEAALLSHPGVRGAVAVVREDAPGERRVVAYTEPHRPGLGADELERHLRERLPAHMVPQTTLVLAALPLTPHGKVDRSALPVPAGRSGAAGPQPKGETERRIARAWAEVLRVDAVGADRNFFDVGGHSLLLVELQHRLQEIAGREIELLDLFQHTSVRAQAAFLDAAPDPAPAAAAPRPEGTQQNALMKRRQQQLRAKRGRHA
ncbi:amino acid adenylation domain-containing protein [Kitasatospora sp. NPDC047058]|uniref:non-ribosomal peptide synthetase n=1 Tax=Kitasatospora sp. NPDC047058 TaxID=3155620 RepID=UPI0033D0CA67